MVKYVEKLIVPDIVASCFPSSTIHLPSKTMVLDAGQPAALAK